MSPEIRIRDSKEFLRDLKEIKDGEYVISSGEMRRLLYLSHRLGTEDRMSGDEMRDQSRTLRVIIGLAEFRPDEVDPPGTIRWHPGRPKEFTDAVVEAGGGMLTSVQENDEYDAVVRMPDRWHRVKPGQRIVKQGDGTLLFPDAR